MDVPFFILGNPRSGTSLFRMMLNSHAEVTVPPECGFVQWWYNKYKNWSLNDTSSSKRIEEYVTDILSSKKIEDWGLDKEQLIALIQEKKPTNYQELSLVIYRSYNNNKEGLIGDKNNYFIHHLDEINLIFPKAKYIHLIRDGRDVACSYLALNKLKTKSVYVPKVANSITDIAKEWSENTEEIEAFLENENSLLIRYEDLLTNTQKTLQLVCDFLVIEFDGNMLNYYKEKHHDEPASTMDWKLKTLEKVDSTNFNKYKKLLSKGEIALFEGIANTQLKKFGYEY